MRIGPYPVQLRPTAIVDDLIAPPGQPLPHGLRFAIGPSGSVGDRRFVRARRIVLDGMERMLGWGWHPEPDMVSFDIPLDRGSDPRHAKLVSAVVRIRGPWEIRFARSG